MTNIDIKTLNEEIKKDGSTLQSHLTHRKHHGSMTFASKAFVCDEGV